MANRSKDWLAQAVRDLEQARSSRAEERHEWACFAAQQAAEKAVKALHLSLGQEAWGHAVARLLSELPLTPSEDLIEKAKVLDNFYVPTRYGTDIPKAPLFNITEKYTAKRQFDMPVRSLNSSVFKWPNRKTVDGAVRTWAVSVLEHRPDVLHLGYFGSYARGDWGVGSDLDLVAIVIDSSEPFEHRSLAWDLNSLPVPSELLVYTLAEWKTMVQEATRFARTLERETVWIFDDCQQEENSGDS